MSADQLPAIDAISIAKGSDSLALAKAKEGEWTIASGEAFPADASKILRFFEDLNKTKYQSKISLSSPAAVEEYGFGSPVKLVISREGKNLLELELGDVRGSGGQYVKLSDKDAYLVDKQIQAHLDQEAWENKTLVNVDKAEVKKVEFYDAQKRKTAEVSREKKEDKLTLANSDKKAKILLDAIDGVERILEKVDFTKRVDHGNEEAKTAMLKTYLTKVELFDGRIFEITTGQVGEKEKEKFYIKITSNKDDTGLNEKMGKWAFEVPNYTAKKFQKTTKDFLDHKGA